MERLLRNEVVHQHARRNDAIGRYATQRNDVVDLGDHRRRGHRHHRVDVARGEGIFEIAELVRCLRLDQRKSGVLTDRSAVCAFDRSTPRTDKYGSAPDLPALAALAIAHLG
jgi:hypothetical protein